MASVTVFKKRKHKQQQQHSMTPSSRNIAGMWDDLFR
jgi:hypothetical protein